MKDTSACQKKILSEPSERVVLAMVHLAKMNQMLVSFYTINSEVEALALMADTIADAQTLLHSLETASGDIGLYVNVKKTEYMSYDQIGTMHTLSGDDIKSVTFFIYLGSNVASTEADVKARIGKA